MPPNAAEAAAIVGNHVRGLAARDSTADWARLPDIPSSEEVLSSEATSDDLPWFPTAQKWQKNDYLETVYKILRFEGIEGLRYSVRTLRSTPNMLDDDNTCVYTKVRVQGYVFARIGPVARVSISTQRAAAKINWKQSKRLQPGKLVALSTDFFQTDCRVGIVAQRPIEGGLDQSPPVVDIFWGDADEAVIDPDLELVMAESRNGYYEAVRHALKGLQHASTEWCPIDKYIQSLDRADLKCSSIPAELNFGSLVDHLTQDQIAKAESDHAKVLMFREIEERFKDCKTTIQLEGIKPYTSLDDSQLKALQRIVSKELAIVQGPPGTGKTFTSVKALRVLLQNRQPGDPPIIVAAQTNHALDQLLIYCKSSGANIMRVGGRTENEDIAKRTMYKLRVATGKTTANGMYTTLERERRRITDRFEDLVAGVFGGSGLLDPKALLDAGVLNQAQYETLVDDGWESGSDSVPMEAWLGGEKTECTRQRMDDPDFDIVEAVDEVELDENFEDQMIDDDDDRFVHGTFVALSCQYTGQTPPITGWERRCKKMLQQNNNLSEIPLGLRGGVYQILLSKLREATSDRFRGILQQAVKLSQQLKIAGWTRDLNVIDKHCIDIMGCTTTGLTKYRGFLAALKPRILLIEEAAETREANITSALYPSIQQLILVGDHQQLPPSCDIARLAKEPYNLNISLFERLVNNDLPFTMLDHQRRMAPELRFIVQKFYPKLQDHPLVKDITKRPLIPGMGDRRSWFFTHAWPEETDGDNSKYNWQEVEMIVGFIRYLLLNHVKTSEITVLTYYKGQKRKILQRLRHKDMPIGNFYNVATVDSYQGEENEIVILSLVRSPPVGCEASVGFLDSRNRATVAISRARRGFFMFGNKTNLLTANQDSFKTWAPIWNGFAEQHRVAMGKGMPLVCQNHENEVWVKDADGFVQNAGGCWIKCEGKLSCGHDCALPCHNIPHEKLPCQHPCTKALPCGHKCAGYCSDSCRCAENCREFNRFQLNIQMARLQVSDDRSISPDESRRMTISNASSGSRSRSMGHNPADWQKMAHNPQAHDDALREALIEDKVNENLELDNRGPGDSAAALTKGLENIQDTFIPIENKNSRRILGKKQTTKVAHEIPTRQEDAKSKIRALVPGSASNGRDVCPRPLSTAQEKPRSTYHQGPAQFPFVGRPVYQRQQKGRHNTDSRLYDRVNGLANSNSNGNGNGNGYRQQSVFRRSTQVDEQSRNMIERRMPIAMNLGNSCETRTQQELQIQQTGQLIDHDANDAASLIDFNEIIPAAVADDSPSRRSQSLVESTDGSDTNTDYMSDDDDGVVNQKRQKEGQLIEL